MITTNWWGGGGGGGGGSLPITEVAMRRHFNTPLSCPPSISFLQSILTIIGKVFLLSKLIYANVIIVCYVRSQIYKFH